MNKTLAKRKNFAQLEDFNVGKDAKAAKYHEEYMKRMNGEAPPPPRPQLKAQDDEEEAKYIGCYTSESSFGDRQYYGGSSGASFVDAIALAKASGKRCVGWEG